MNGKRGSTAASVFLIGIMAVFFGLWGAFSPDSDPYDIECDGQRMNPGDRCISLDGGNDGTYEELVAEKRASAETGETAFPLLLVGGIVLAVGSVLGMGISASREPKPPVRESPDKPVDRDW